MAISNKIAEMVNNQNESLPFSGVVLVQDKDEIIFEKAYGYANRSERIPNTLDTRFGMASGCKIFTSVAICQLVERGILSFDTLLKDCINIDLPHFDPSITIHHLLTHCSGIPDYFDEEVMDDFEELWETLPMYTIKSPEDFLPMFQNNHMKFAPGEKFSYNNAGFILLGLIVERMTGMGFPKYIEENVFHVCGMLDSGYFRMDQLPERTALGYIDSEEGNAWRTNVYSVPIIGGPDGGAFTSVRDLVKFWEALFEHKLLTKELTEKLLSPHIHVNKHLYYGYGVWISTIDNEIFKYFVMGSDPGVALRSSVYAESKIHAHVISNIGKGPGVIATRIDDIIRNS